MRKRLDQRERRRDILEHARRLFHARGYTATEMEDVRAACGLSRGGLYHHFGHKGAILDALVVEEIDALAQRIEGSERSPIETLLEAGSSHLGRDPGIVAALASTDERRRYLSALDRAVACRLAPLLGERLAGAVRPGVEPHDVAELFLAVNAHVNRRSCTGGWSEARAARFAATALAALEPLLSDATGLRTIIHRLRERGTRR